MVAGTHFPGLAMSHTEVSQDWWQRLQAKQRARRARGGYKPHWWRSRRAARRACRGYKPHLWQSVSSWGWSQSFFSWDQKPVWFNHTAVGGTHSIRGYEPPRREVEAHSRQRFTLGTCVHSVATSHTDMPPTSEVLFKAASRGQVVAKKPQPRKAPHGCTCSHREKAMTGQLTWWSSCTTPSHRPARTMRHKWCCWSRMPPTSTQQYCCYTAAARRSASRSLTPTYMRHSKPNW